MYPADKYNILYFDADLPFDLIVNQALTTGDQFYLIKYSTAEWRTVGPLEPGESRRVIHNSNQMEWQFQTYVGIPPDDTPVDWEGTPEILFLTGYNYLFGVRNDRPFFLTDYFDTFASSYTVTGPNGSELVTRHGIPIPDYGVGIFGLSNVLCIWSSENYTLRYNSILCKFQVNGKIKSGLQNTPVGSYDGGYTVS